jgi:hypothetical protein
MIKSPNEGKNIIYTDASGVIGVGGTLVTYDGKKHAFQIKWENTNWQKLTQKRSKLDIQVQELLGALIALDTWQHLLKNNTVSIYNDNGGAANAIISKAPALHRNDLQCLTRQLALLAIKNNIMFWGIKIDGINNEYADHLSRFYKT